MYLSILRRYNFIFNSVKLREHLIQCFENEQLTEFPTTKKTISLRRTKQQKNIKIENYCICNLPDCLGDQVQCDKCSEWYHKHCVNAPNNISHSYVEFLCINCV